MLDEGDHLVSPTSVVVEDQVIAVRDKKFGHCNKSSSFIPLLECVRHSHPGKQSHRERNNVLFAVSECVSRARQGAPQQPLIAQKVLLTGNCDQRPINIDDCLKRQPSRFIRQGL